MPATPRDCRDRPEPIVIGVLGGIAAGKTAVAELLAGARGRVLAADTIARELLDEPHIRARILERYGPELFDARGALRREELARRVFSDPERRLELESWIHPGVRARIRAGLAEARAAGVECIVLDVPLLLENEAEHGLAALCDQLVFVEVPLEERDRRAVATRGWSAGEVARREQAQLPLSEKRARADHVIPNQGTRAELERAVAGLRHRLGLT